MKKDLMIDLAWGGGSIAVALIATIAHTLGYINQDTVVRTIGMNGLMIVYYGNRAPKSLAPNDCERNTRWMAGWTMVVSGFIYAGVFAFAPIPVAMTVGIGAVLTGIAVTFAYGRWLGAKTKEI